jgi:hypothetical protein
METTNPYRVRREVVTTGIRDLLNLSKSRFQENIIFHQERKKAMEEKLIEIKKEEQTEEKKAYTPPELVVYGKLTDLTAGGKSGNSEPSGGPNKNDLTRRS